MTPLGALVRLATAVLFAALPACRCGSSASGVDGVDGAAAPVTSDLTGTTPPGDPDPAVLDASNRFLEAAPKADLDLAGPGDPACTGAEIAFAVAVVDPRCAIESARAKKLRTLLERDGGAVALRQEAKVLEGGRVEVRLVNTGGTPLMLPLSFHRKLPAFTVLAEDEQHTLYELDPPQLELRDDEQRDRSHFARIVLAPGGAAVASVAISTSILRVLGRGPGDRCKDAGANAGLDAGSCNATRIPKGRYMLHVGELLADVEAGAPARVTWVLP